MSAPPRGGSSRFDVFLSYDSRDRAHVERIAERLKHAGVEPWLDRWSLTPGGDWQSELGAGFDASVACAVFVGAHDLGAWELQEAAMAIARAATQRGFRVFPVLLPGVQEPFDPNRLPHFLRARTWVDFRRGRDDGRALQDLINAVNGVPFGSGVPLQPSDDVAPYRGLRVFGEDDARFFFGRDREVQRLLEKLKSSAFVAVLGSSGSGKSSLARAGLVSALRGGALTQGEDWHVCLVRPGAAPLTALAAQVAKLQPGQAMQATLDALTRDPRTLHLSVELALADRDVGERVLMIVDQLEEVFTLCRDEAQRRQLFATLLYAASAPGGRTVVVVTMRADFYPRCAAYPELAQLIAAQQMLVGPMDSEGLRQAIEEPARRVGLQLEDGLADTILADVGAEPGALPLLEHALLELWERRRAGMLTLEGYMQAGGVQGALAQRADEIFEQLSPAEQQIARRVLLRLTQPGEGTEDTRRRANRSELAPADGGAAFDEVLRRLVDARMLTTGRDETGHEIVDVSHEALIRGWPRLREWINADRAGLLIHRRLTEAAGEWNALGRDAGALYRGARLAATREWTGAHAEDISSLERDFVAESQAAEDSAAREQTARLNRELRAANALAGAQQRARRRLQWVAAVLLVGALVAGASSVIAVDASRTADQQRRLAEARSLAAAAAEQLPVDPELGLLLATEAARRAQVPAVENALRAAMQSPIRVALRGHRTPIYHAEFSRDGLHAVSVGEIEPVRVWDLRTGAGRTLGRGEENREGATFSRDGRLILTGGDRLRLWDAATTRPVGAPFGIARNGGILAEFSPDGQRILSLTEDGTVRILDTRSRHVIHELLHVAAPPTPFNPRQPRLHRDASLAATFSPDSRSVATVSPRGLELWDAGSGQRRWLRRGDHKNVAFDRGGRRLVTNDVGLSFEPGIVRIRSVSDGHALEHLKLGHAGLANDPVFIGDGRQVLVANQLWEPASGRLITLGRAPDTEDGINRAAASSDGRRIATTFSGRTEIWDAGSGRRLSVLPAGTSPAGEVRIGPDGHTVLTGHADGSIDVWDPDVSALAASRPLLPAVAVSPDARRVAAITRAGSVELWDAKSGRELDTPLRRLRLCGRAKKCTAGSASMDFNTDASRLHVVVDGVGVIVELASGKIAKRYRSSGSLAFSADGRRVAIASSELDDGLFSVFINDVATGKIVDRNRGANGGAGVALSKTGSVLLTNDGGTADVWSTATNKHLGQVDPTPATGLPFESFAALSTDGTLAAIPLEGDVVRVLSSTTGAQVSRIVGHRGRILGTSFSPDARYVITSSADGTTRVSEVADGSLVATFASAGAAAMTPDNKRLVVIGPRHPPLVYACAACAPWQELVKSAERRTPRELTRAERGRFLGG